VNNYPTAILKKIGVWKLPRHKWQGFLLTLTIVRYLKVIASTVVITALRHFKHFIAIIVYLTTIVYLTIVCFLLSN